MRAKTSAVTDAVPDFDLGPLSWVQGEIGQALARGLDLLAAFRAAPSDPALLRQARNHDPPGRWRDPDGRARRRGRLHRRDRAAAARLEELGPTDSTPACAVIDRACRKLVIFLDELVGGTPPVPLKLFPEYEAMQRARGVKAAAATDLFFPDMTAARAAARRAAARRAEKARGASGQAAPGLPERPARIPARRRRRRAQDARRGRRHGARQRAGVGTGLLVDRRRVLRRHHRGRARAGFRREAARRAARPPDSPRRRRIGEGRRRGCGARCSITSP